MKAKQNLDDETAYGCVDVCIGEASNRDLGGQAGVMNFGLRLPGVYWKTKIGTKQKNATIIDDESMMVYDMMRKYCWFM